jgi:hypothetical protein
MNKEDYVSYKALCDLRAENRELRDRLKWMTDDRDFLQDQNEQRVTDCLRLLADLVVARKERDHE